MIEKMKVCPVLENFTLEERKILEKKNKRVWLIATFFDQQINEIWSQYEFKILCLSDPKENEDFFDPMTLKGGQREQNLHLKILLLKHFSREIEDLVRGKERFLNNPDKYGYCQECGEAIPLERLRMVPQARLCVPCSEGR